MKKKYLFLTAAIAMLSLAGCNKDKPAPGDSDTGTGIQGYLTVKISAPDISRTSGSPTDPGDPAESVINSVTIVFTDDNGLVEYVKTPNLVASTTTTEPFTVEVGDYKLYALVNNPGSNAILTGEDIQRIIDVATVADAEEGFESGSFFMVNARHNGAQEAGVDVTIDNTHIETNPLHAQVSVDRVAVKISDGGSPASFPITTPANFPTGASTLSVEGFVMLNINKQFNMIQEWGDENKNGLPLTAGADVLQTPLYTNGPIALVKNQYFRNISEYTAITKNGGGDITEITDLVRGVVPSPFTFDIKYATENRPTIIFNTLGLTAGQGETTGVIYKVVAQDGAGNPLPTFYSYRGVLYSTVMDVETGGGFTPGELTPLTNPQLRARGVKAYEDGVMYYNYFILDPNPTYLYDSQNYYGVFRNSIYNLTINSINNVGDDVPGGGRVDPGEPGEPGNPPIDADEAYIEVEITINPWVLNTIGIDF